MITNNKNRFTNDFRVDTTVVSCRMPVEIKADLMQLAKLYNTSISTIVYTLVKEELEKRKFNQ